MTHTAFASIAARNALALVRVLTRSLHEHHPDLPFFVLLADEPGPGLDPAAEPFEVVRLEDLAIPDLPRFRFSYSREELTYASTPYLLERLLDRGFERAAFCKQESLVVGSLEPIVEQLGRASISLTPHLLAPLAGTSEGIARELNILQSGVYNVGFLGVSATPTARRFLAWWKDRTYAHCLREVEAGMHYEQRWLDLVPAFFEDFQLLRDPGLNVGHWNLPEREVRRDGEGFTVNGQPCRFVRFSGFDPEVPDALTRYSDRLRLSRLGPAAEIFERYRGRLFAEGWRETRGLPYAWDRFDNGIPIPALVRRLYRDLGDDAARFGDPFRTASPGSFFAWLREPADSPSGLSRLWQAIYEQRTDVQEVYPDPAGGDREGFLRWAEEFGLREHGLDATCLPFPPPLQESP